MRQPHDSPTSSDDERNSHWPPRRLDYAGNIDPITLRDYKWLKHRSQGWGRLQKPDYDYSAHKIIDYDYSGDWKGDYDYNHPITITITVTCLPWKRF